jgi:formate dehydrogenase subunit gamma
MPNARADNGSPEVTTGYPAIRSKLNAHSPIRRLKIWSLIFLTASILALAAVGYDYAAPQAASAPAEQRSNPRANFWRYVREGNGGYTAASGSYTTNVLIRSGGNDWRQIRNGPLMIYGASLMGIVIAAIAAFYWYRGRIRIESGRAGVRVPRFTLNDRMVHWFAAVTFVVLAVTGLILLYGRVVLIPLFGFSGFAAIASAGKYIHNLFGPIFAVAVVLLVIKFLSGNLPEAGDLKWFRDGGGLLGKHTSCGRYNAGEKIWFWLVAVTAITVSVTGLVLDFPLFSQTRDVMQLSQLIHAAAAIVFVAGALGHIYIGTLGMEGALESMTQGSVDANWAKAHHDRWYADMERRQRVRTFESTRSEVNRISTSAAAMEQTTNRENPA